jgi:hypothetical protein
LLGALGALGACKRDAKKSDPARTASARTALVEAAEDDAPSAAPADQKRGAAKQAGERVTIAAGKTIAGSTPGDLGRDPTLEPALFEVELGEFQIDRLPYPNDPSKPPVTSVTRARATEMCSQAGGRLCTELEWERACKGPDGQSFAGSSGWDASCAKRPEMCASGFGVLAMGGAMREWTASQVEPIKNYRSNTAAAVRGAPPDAADVDHRCAHRMAVDDSSSSGDLGFRCCYGAANAAAIPSPQWLATVQKVELGADRLAALFASNPKLKSLADGVKFFREEATVSTVLKRGQACSDAGAPAPAETLTTSPLLWNPVPGEEILLVTGQSAGNKSFIVAFHRLPGDRHRVAAAFLMSDEPGPVALVYNPNVKKKLEWAIGWQCHGESGNITYRDEHRVAITQK